MILRSILRLPAPLDDEQPMIERALICGIIGIILALLFISLVVGAVGYRHSIMREKALGYGGGIFAISIQSIFDSVSLFFHVLSTVISILSWSGTRDTTTITILNRISKFKGTHEERK
jgi:hypothetical protein